MEKEKTLTEQAFESLMLKNNLLLALKYLSDQKGITIQSSLNLEYSRGNDKIIPELTHIRNQFHIPESSIENAVIQTIVVHNETIGILQNQLLQQYKETLAFPKWLSDNDYIKSADDLWYKKSDGNGKGITIKDLYENFELDYTDTLKEKK